MSIFCLCGRRHLILFLFQRQGAEQSLAERRIKSEFKVVVAEMLQRQCDKFRDNDQVKYFGTRLGGEKYFRTERVGLTSVNQAKNYFIL